MSRHRHIPRHKRRRRSFRLPFLASAGVLAVLVTGFGGTQEAQAGPDPYHGRYEEANVCIQWGHLDKAKSKWAVKNAARAWRDRTDNITIRIREWCPRGSQKLVAHDYWKRDSGHRGWWWPGKRTWTDVSTNGPWTQNGYMYTYRWSKFALYVGDLRGESKRRWLALASHEIGHALGLVHHKRYNKSVMWSSYSSSRPARPAWRDYEGRWSENGAGVDKIYAKG